MFVCEIDGVFFKVGMSWVDGNDSMSWVDGNDSIRCITNQNHHSINNRMSLLGVKGME